MPTACCRESWTIVLPKAIASTDSENSPSSLSVPYSIVIILSIPSFAASKLQFLPSSITVSIPSLLHQSCNSFLHHSFNFFFPPSELQFLLFRISASFPSFLHPSFVFFLVSANA
jgi:hypothetical protein